MIPVSRKFPLQYIYPISHSIYMLCFFKSSTRGGMVQDSRPWYICLAKIVCKWMFILWIGILTNIRFKFQQWGVCWHRKSQHHLVDLLCEQPWNTQPPFHNCCQATTALHRSQVSPTVEKRNLETEWNPLWGLDVFSSLLPGNFI